MVALPLRVPPHTQLPPRAAPSLRAARLQYERSRRLLHAAEGTHEHALLDLLRDLDLPDSRLQEIEQTLYDARAAYARLDHLLAGAAGSKLQNETRSRNS